MQVVLVMFRADGERRSFSVARDMTVIGRREDCDLRIPVGEVSRKHCRLIREGDDVLRVEDLGSSNGTLVNDQRLPEAILQPGDRLQVGPVTFLVQIDGVPADEDLQPPVPASSADETATGVPQVEVDEAPVEEAVEAQPGEEDVSLKSLEEVAEAEGESLPEAALEEDLQVIEEAPVPTAEALSASPPPVPANGESEDWNFVVEDDSQQSQGGSQVDLQIDLNSHTQPHGHA